MTDKHNGAAQRHSNPASIFRQAQLAFEASDFQRSHRLAERAISLEPNHIGCWELSARSLWRLGNYEEALLALERLITLYPYEPGYFYLKGMILQGLGKCGPAIEAMQRCIQGHAPNENEQAAKALRELEEWQAAMIAESLEMDRDFRILYRRDPIAACRARGFRIASDEYSLTNLRRQVAERALLWTRPE